MKKRRICLAMALALVMALGCIPALGEAQEPVQLTFATMQEGTGAYTYAAALKEIMEAALPAGSTIELTTDSPGAVDAPTMLEEGGCDLVMSNAGPALWYAEQNPDTVVRALCGGLGYDFLNVMVSEEFATEQAVFTVEEIFEKQLPVRLVIKEEGTLGALAAEKLLEALGVTEADIGSWGGAVIRTDSSGIREAFEAGEADLTIDHISAWQENTTQLCENVHMVFPQLQEETLVKLQEAGFGVVEVEPGMFAGQSEAIATVGSQQVVLVSKDMDADLAETLARAVCEHAAELAEVSEALQRFVPMYAGTASLCGAQVHPGAALYYWQMEYPSK